MDFERIKQNLRIRSGRTKTARKAKPQRQPFSSALGQPPPQSKTKPPDEKSSPAQEPEKTEKVESQQNAPSTPERPKEKQKKSNSHNSEEPRADEETNGTISDPKKCPEISSRESVSKAAASEVKVTQGPGFREETPTKQPPETSPTSRTNLNMSSDHSDNDDYDLRPPPRKPKRPSLEGLSELLFSPGHLETILHDPQLLSNFSSFLSRYKSGLTPNLTTFLGTQKAVRAVEYANAVAAALPPSEQIKEAGGTSGADFAATISDDFSRMSKSSFEALMSQALPAYVTYSLVKVATECLINEIIGKSTPIMRDLVGGLSEVFCLTNPNEEDNPIIYASQEFYRLTGYDVDNVIGSNCRFLQGPKTKRDAPQRLRDGQDKGEQACETLLNYRRDGRAFVNLLMIAPLFDNNDKIKYYIGAQVDVSRLVEGGKGLDGFERFLARREDQDLGRGRRKEPSPDERKQEALEKLRQLSEMFDLEEAAVVQSHSRSNSLSRDDDSITSKSRPRSVRRVFADDEGREESKHDDSDDEDRETWSLGQSGSSGRLPGVYERYMLIRPAPSLRVIFVSPRLRKIGKVLQSPFLSHVAASTRTLSGLRESFENGVPVTAKIGFMPDATQSRHGLKTDDQDGKDDAVKEAIASAKTCWISATPLLGGEMEVGVWMIVLVQQDKSSTKPVVQQLASQGTPETVNRSSSRNVPETPTKYSDKANQMEESLPNGSPIKPKRLDSGMATATRGDTTGSKTQREPEKDSEKLGKTALKSHAGQDSKTLTADHSEANAGNDDVIVRRHQSSSPQKSDRVVIRSDSDDEEQNEKQSFVTAADTAEGEYEAKSRPESPPEEDQETIRNESPPAEGPRDGATAESETARDIFDLTPTSSRPPSSQAAGPETNSARPTGMLYMDYLRHPGSGSMTSSALPRNEHFDDPNCARSPYSVD